MLANWAKIPTMRATMLAHSEVEWIRWVDTDVVLTDMDLSLLLDMHMDYNLVVYSWPKEVYHIRSFVGINVGVFLTLNYQWSLDLMDVWVRMDPASPEHDN